MATATAAEQHGMYSPLPFNKEPSISVTDTYSLTADDDLSPSTQVFPVGQPSPILSNSGPTPNPPFVFPARPAVSSAPPSFSKATGRRPRSAYELQGGLVGSGREGQTGPTRSLPPPLPNFSFSPTTLSQNGGGMVSPPLSPNSPGSARSIPSRPGGHRRGGSEFIGGDGKSGTGLGLMSTSPTKGDGILPPPNAQPSLGSSAGRRGHAHRRSAAMSCHDISMIVKPASPSHIPLGGSAPTSPAGNEHPHMSFPALDNTVRSNIATASLVVESDKGSNVADSPPRTSNRARVGFSDTIEFIPRPLSLVSSDASSTTTMRPGHSVSNSLSSLMSAGAASPPSKEQRGQSSGAKSVETRPSTAGAILGSTTESTRLDGGQSSPQRRNSIQLTSSELAEVVERPLTPRLLPRKNFFFFGHDNSGGESSPTKSRPVSSGSSDRSRNVLNISAPTSPNHPLSDIPITSTEDDPAPSQKHAVTRKPSKKQKKVKSWAGSILSRKPRQRSQKQKALSRRSPTPPLRSFEPMVEAISDSMLNQASNPSAVDDSAQSSSPQATSSLQTNFASWKPRQVLPQDEESMSPIIDLDAALGPFNTPSGYDADWEASQRGSGHSKRRMHSAAGMGGFLGPYHRRAESAPEMVAFDNPRFGLHHIGSRSTMEDVFEEDEENDDWEEMKTVSHKGSKTAVEEEGSATPGLGIDIKVEDAEIAREGTGMDWTSDEAASSLRGIKRKGSGLSEGDRRQANSNAKSEVCRLDEHAIKEDTSVIELTDDSVLSRPDSAAKSFASESTPTPPLRPHAAKELAPVDIQPLAFQQPFLTPTSFSSMSHSPFPSPRSPMSYDAQRISTAPSSFTDERGFQSLLLGEPGPELRMSVDDVPSLTSSNSTMTRESAINPGFNNPQFRSGQRSASLSSPSVTLKRSSIASLSRLLHSSHGEKSKLSIEERAPSSPEKKEKSGKGKRLSRMMQFWKPRDSSPS